MPPAVRRLLTSSPSGSLDASPEGAPRCRVRPRVTAPRANHPSAKPDDPLRHPSDVGSGLTPQPPRDLLSPRDAHLLPTTSVPTKRGRRVSELGFAGRHPLDGQEMLEIRAHRVSWRAAVEWRRNTNAGLGPRGRPTACVPLTDIGASSLRRSVGGALSRPAPATTPTRQTVPCFAGAVALRDSAVQAPLGEAPANGRDRGLTEG